MIEDIVVSDTNIFIDLLTVELLDVFFQLPYRVWTTVFVLEELTDAAQKTIIQAFVETGKLAVKEYNAEELSVLVAFSSARTNNVSLTDCSVWRFSCDNGYLLLTGDGTLRTSSELTGTRVSGVLFVFDQLVTRRIIPPKDAADRLRHLFSVNKRLPKGEIDRRLQEWG